jgi:hypothetical protein
MLASNETALRAYLGRILGWSGERTQAIEHALRSIHLSVSHRAALVVLGDTDPVAIAHALHCHTIGADRPFVVCDPRHRSDMRPATVRGPTSYKHGAAAVQAARGGSLCVRRRRMPYDFSSSVALVRDPSADVQIIVCGAVDYDSDAFIALPVPILVPPLVTRASEVPRIIDEYAAEAISTLGADDACFTDLDRTWTINHAAGSLAEIEKATLRLVALRMLGNIAQAAKRLGMSPIALRQWLGHRGRWVPRGKGKRERPGARSRC